jgi:hypothetical protein
MSTVLDPLVRACCRLLGGIAVLLSQLRSRLSRAEFERLLAAHQRAVEQIGSNQRMDGCEPGRLEEMEGILERVFQKLETGVIDRQGLGKLERFCLGRGDLERSYHSGHEDSQYRGTEKPIE